MGFNLTGGSCESICAVGSYYNSTNSSCESCLFDCMTCLDSSSCSSCDLANDFREIDPNSSRCAPIVGYYESNVPVSGKCREGCASCSSYEHCLSCGEDYVLTGNRCERSETSLGLIIGLVIASVLVVILVGLSVFFKCRKKVHDEGSENQPEKDSSPPPSKKKITP